MAEKSEALSPLRRARLGIMHWLNVLPNDVRLDAMLALDKLVDDAEREIDRAYWDGYSHHRFAKEVEKLSKTSG